MSTIPKLRKILIQRCDRLGDNVFVAPVIEQLRQSFPSAQLDLLTSPVGQQLHADHPHLKTIFVINPQTLSHWGAWWQEVKRIRAEGYDAYISLWNNPRLAALGLAAGIPLRCGDIANVILSLFYNATVWQPWGNLTWHQIDFNLAVLAPLGLSPSTSTRKLYLNKTVSHEMEREWNQHIKDNQTVMVIICGTGGSSEAMRSQTIKQWIVNNRERLNIQCVLTGQLSEDDPLTSYAAKGVWNRINSTTVAQLMAIINKADIVLGGDTGPSHIASFLNKPLIFYTPLKSQSPSSWGPFSDCLEIIRQDYLLPEEMRVPLEEQVTQAFDRLTQQINTQLTPTDKTKHFRLLKHGIRVLACDSDAEPFSRSDQNRLDQLKEQGLVLFSHRIENSWLGQMRTLIRIIRQRNISVIIAPSFPVGVMGVIRFVMGTVIQYRKPIGIPMMRIINDDLETFWAECIKSKW